jgi:hypothetical protein
MARRAAIARHKVSAVPNRRAEPSSPLTSLLTGTKREWPPPEGSPPMRMTVPWSGSRRKYAFAAAPNLRSRSRSAVGGYAVSVRAEPVEEHKDSRIILDITGCGHRLNNRAAILKSKIT